MRLLGERCRTDDDWSSLLGVLLQISLSDRPPPLDREPIYRWTVGRLPAQGLKPMRPRRRKAGEGASTKERAERQALLVGDRKTKRQRLRQVLDGAPEKGEGELAVLARWVLDDAEASDARRGEERELLAEEMQFAMRKLVAAAQKCKAEADYLRAEAAKQKFADEGPEMEEGVAEDVLRAAAGGGHAGATAGEIAEEAVGRAVLAAAARALPARRVLAAWRSPEERPPRANPRPSLQRRSSFRRSTMARRRRI